MFRPFLGATALLALSGCSSFDKLGVYMLTLPVTTNTTCATTYSENITDSDPPVEDTVTDEWVYTDEEMLSDEILFMQLFRERSGNYIAQINNATYIGASEGGVITLSHVGTQDIVYGEQLASEGYSYNETDVTTVTTTISLTKNDTKGYDGNWKVDSTQVLHWDETDEWDSVAVGITSGSINGAIFTWLEGTGSNNADMPDCDSATCFIDVTETCGGSTSFTAVETDLDSDAFEGVENAGQNAGAF